MKAQGTSTVPDEQEAIPATASTKGRARARRLGSRFARAVGKLISAVLLLVAPERRLECRPERFERLAGATMLLGLAWGLVLVALWVAFFRLTWPRYLNWVVPSAAVALAMAGGLHCRAAFALIETALGRDPWRQRAVAAVLTAGASAIVDLASWKLRPSWATRLAARWPTLKKWRAGLALAGVTVGLAVMLNASVHNIQDWSTRLPQAWAWLWPRDLYRVLLLTPLWGAWSMLALGQFHRPTERCDAAARHFARSIGPLAAAAWLVAPLAGSLVYLSFLFPWHFVPPAGALAAALGGGAALVRLGGGLSRRALLASNFLTQLAFLGAYLAVK